MKIAVITDDGETISAHFGRAPYFSVYTIEDGAITARELRQKAGHDDFAGAEHEHEHEHGEHHEHHGRDDPRGHGFGRGAGKRHTAMMTSITDCDVVLARGMGQGAYQSLKQAGIMPLTTDIRSVEAAVQAYLEGNIVDRPERRH
jgi:predicted Fe-Mo cluster-binding NifX family protein